MFFFFWHRGEDENTVCCPTVSPLLLVRVVGRCDSRDGEESHSGAVKLDAFVARSEFLWNYVPGLIVIRTCVRTVVTLDNTQHEHVGLNQVAGFTRRRLVLRRYVYFMVMGYQAQRLEF